MQDVTPLAYTPDQAAAMLNVSRDFFDQHIKPELAVIRRGRRILIPRTSLDSWITKHGRVIAA